MRVIVERDCADIDRNALVDICHDAKPGAIKLYIYLCNLPMRGIYDSQSFCKTCNVVTTTANTSFQELIDLGYLEKIDTDSYNFFTTNKKNDQFEA